MSLTLHAATRTGHFTKLLQLSASRFDVYHDTGYSYMATRCLNECDAIECSLLDYFD